jgi:DNA-binding CsgD family transcriptional regulator
VDPTTRLGPRETDTLRHLAAGRSLGETAIEMHVTKGTVRSYVRGIYTKLGVGTREDAVRVGRRLGHVTDACPTCGMGGTR